MVDQKQILRSLINAVCIAQSLQSTDELKRAVVGGQVGDDGKWSTKALNDNGVFTYAVQIHTRVEQISEGATGANQRTTTTEQNHLLTTSAKTTS